MEGRVIRIIRNVDFSVMEEYPFDGAKDGIGVRFERKHGTVLYVAGVVENDENALMCFGVEDGKTEGRIAFYKDFGKFDKGWRKLIAGL